MKDAQVNHDMRLSRFNSSTPWQVFLYLYLMTYAARGNVLKLLVGQTLRLSSSMLAGHIFIGKILAGAEAKSCVFHVFELNNSPSLFRVRSSTNDKWPNSMHRDKVNFSSFIIMA